MSIKEIKKYDEGKNLVYKKDSAGNEYWYKYDNGNRIYSKWSNDCESWAKFDEYNRMIYYKDSGNKWEFW